ncbi:MAG: alpha/beta hydrolase [Rhizobiaceae bacterium]|nr:alpha/beta hydrolase [Rhizobiaceae bacterium]
MPFTSQQTLPSPTGAQLNLHMREADGAARGVVQINHGLAEHAARYARFADFLAARGFITYAHDHRGHGETTAPGAPARMFGPLPSGDKVIADVEAVHALIAERHPGLPVITFGHSMGGLIAMNHTLRYPGRAAAAAIFNAQFTPGLAVAGAKAVLAWERFRLGSDAASRIIPRLTFRAWAKQIRNRRTDFDWLSRDAAEVDKYIADPLCGWDASVAMWTDLFGFIAYVNDDIHFGGLQRDKPFYLVGGERDPSTEGGKLVLRFEKRLHGMGFSNLVSRVYPQTRHECLNDINRDAVMQDFAIWAEKIIG